MQHKGQPRGRSGFVVLSVSGVVFVVTVACAAVLLPSTVDVYRTPADQPDVVYARWQYLLLVAAGAAVLAAASSALASALLSLVGAFRRVAPSDAAEQAPAWVSAWVLLCSSAAVWLAIWLGNSSRRSWLELVTGLLGLAGVGLIIGWQAKRASRTAA